MTKTLVGWLVYACFQQVSENYYSCCRIWVKVEFLRVFSGLFIKSLYICMLIMT